ncbi:peptide ABC transporter substrate-binding protein [Levilactobacillus tongjiangensis]|uniref:Peptide ABC transporter substrate-binding protein n=1 Tax=Levilactobacillus tongjiangensis TaxID=2486023 RepID=A0ABW1SST2_9LACO|nr:peptide ABC transporter substrate-binding protein [Levilactobacillus tongjiangensis]
MSLRNHKKALLLCSGIILVGGIFAITAHSKSTKTAVSQDLNLYQTAPITSLDVAKITDSVSSNALSQVGEGLYRLNANSEAENALATKTTVSDNGHQYTINLRHDGKWSNGQPVTAQDFVYSWERTLNPKSKSEFTYQFANIKNANAIAAGKKAPATLGVKAVGKYQLKITLSQPAAYFKKMLASTTYYPLNQKAVDKYGKKYGSSAATTVYNGPFVLTNWNGTSDTWTLKKNATYAAAKSVKLKRISYKVIKSSTTSYNLYQSKKLDAVTLDGEQTTQNKNNPDLKSISQGRIGFIQYNQKDKVAANRDLRTAISLAINRQQLTTKVLKNGSQPAKTFAIKNMLKNPKTGNDFTADAKVKNTVDYNPTLAKKLYQQALKQLGKKSASVTITCGDDDASQNMAEFIQSALSSKLGLKVHVQAMPFTSMLSNVSKGNFQLNLTSWSMDYADPIQSLQILESTNNSNMGDYDSKTYDQALNASEGRDALKSTARYTDLVKAAQTAAKDQAVTPLYEGRTGTLVSPKIKGVVYNKFNGSADYTHAYVGD